MKSYQLFFAELKRRKVFKVAAVYGAVGYGVLQLADILVPAMGLPDALTRGIALVTILGFPIAIVLAWALEVTPDGVRRTEQATATEVREIASDTKRSRWPVGFAAGVGTALLLWAGWWALAPDSGQGTSPGDTLSGGTLDDQVLAVLPFAVQGGPDVQYLGDGMVGLLSTKLDGAGDLRTVDSQTILRIADREEYAPGEPGSAVNVASVFGAGLYVVGEIVEAAGRMQVSATLHRADADAPLAEATIDGSVDEVFGIVDELTARLLSGIRGGPAARVQRIATVTTASVPALKAFLEGEEHFRRAQFGAGVESFRRATEADTLFALAYYRLSLAAEWSFANKLSLDAAERAVALSDRLSARDRRVLDAYLTRRRGDNDAAASKYRSILGTYPDEMEAWLDLSEILFHANPLAGKSFTESRESLTRVLEFDPNHATALIHLARVSAYEADSAAVDSLTQRFIDLAPEAGRNLELSVVRALGMRDSAAVAEVTERFSATEDAAVALATWAAGVFAYHMPTALAASEELTAPHRSPEARRYGYALLAHLATSQGLPDQAEGWLAELAQLSPGMATEYRSVLALLPFELAPRERLRQLKSDLERLDPASVETSDNPSIIFTANDPLHDVFRAYLLGLVSAQLGDAADAERYAEQLDGTPAQPTDGTLPQDLALSVRADVARLDGRPEDALALLEGARLATWYAQTSNSTLFSQVRERFVRAELLAEVGRINEARRWYETIGQLSVFDLPYRIEADRRLAEMDADPGEVGP
jgi:TolB-like protein